MVISTSLLSFLRLAGVRFRHRIRLATCCLSYGLSKFISIRSSVSSKFRIYGGAGQGRALSAPYCCCEDRCVERDSRNFYPALKLHLYFFLLIVLYIHCNLIEGCYSPCILLLLIVYCTHSPPP